MFGFESYARVIAPESRVRATSDKVMEGDSNPFGSGLMASALATIAATTASSGEVIATRADCIESTIVACTSKRLNSLSGEDKQDSEMKRNELDGYRRKSYRRMSMVLYSDNASPSRIYPDQVLGNPDRRLPLHLSLLILSLPTTCLI